jgi:hypothetical protein
MTLIYSKRNIPIKAYTGKKVDFIRRSGFHSKASRRQLREGVLDGYEASVGGASLVRIG